MQKKEMQQGGGWCQEYALSVEAARVPGYMLALIDTFQTFFFESGTF